MSKTNVRIDRLEIRFKGVSPHAARSLVSSLGNELLEQISKRRNFVRGNHGVHAETVDAGTLKVEQGATPSELRKSAATRIAGAVLKNR